MSSEPLLLTPVLVLSAPLLLLLAGLVPEARANARPRLMASISGAATWLSLICALAAAAFHLVDETRSWTLYSIALPGDWGAFSFGTYVNAVTLIMLPLVSFVGVVVTRYARSYLDGDPNQGRFNKWLSLTLAAILTLIVSGNLLMFALAWIATSLCLHQILVFYRDRPAAVLAAHKKFVFSRIGDLSLLVAVFLIGSALGTLEFADLFERAADMEGPLPASLTWASLLIVLSAALKSAQFPFHGWLIQVMEAPTPVSALLHAGIVNAGAFLVMRMSPIVSQSEVALGLLAVIGLVTLALASLVMLTQTSIKVSLAWSTTAQMGFMLLECGLGLYSLAMLHLVAHSLYKAHAFLACGSSVDAFRAPAMAYPAPNASPLRSGIALAVAALMTLAVGAAFGVGVEEQPALLAAGAILTVAIGQLLLQAVGMMDTREFLARAVGLGALVAVSYFALHAVFEHALAGSVVPLRETGGAFQSVLAAVIVGSFACLLVLQQVLKSTRSPMTETLYLHLYNGLYIDVLITRLLQRLWPSPMPAPTAPTVAFAKPEGA